MARKKSQAEPESLNLYLGIITTKNVWTRPLGCIPSPAHRRQPAEPLHEAVVELVLAGQLRRGQQAGVEGHHLGATAGAPPALPARRPCVAGAGARGGRTAALRRGGRACRGSRMAGRAGGERPRGGAALGARCGVRVQTRVLRGLPPAPGSAGVPGDCPGST